MLFIQHSQRCTCSLRDNANLFTREKLVLQSTETTTASFTDGPIDEAPDFALIIAAVYKNSCCICITKFIPNITRMFYKCEFMEKCLLHQSNTKRESCS